ncbi:hypothetical protein ABZ721_10635 [Streptomyces sp. NPDC006733]|uniref:calcium-binding protein n=1 Tax=Streptomyces sp. NPDC006733 TaxID=3155460 RepID=UPI0033FB5097
MTTVGAATLTVDTAGSNFDTVLTAYTGASLATLTEVACNDDGLGVGGASTMTFSAGASTTYWLRVDGYEVSQGGNQGTVVINLQFLPTCTITGTAGNDTINGTNGDDATCGLGGDDTINGGNGNDTISGGPGADTIDGQNGSDTLYGDLGDVDLDGQNGNDTLYDHTGTDTMSGSLGNDNIDVQDGAGSDTANGGLGSDTCAIDAGDTATSC